MVKKLFSVYSSNFFLGILGIITVPILLKNIGVEGYGYYGIYLTLLSYFTLFELGIIKHFTKLISQKKTEVNEIISCFYYFTVSIILLFIPITILITILLFGIGWKTAVLIGVSVSLEYIFYLPTKIYSSYSTANKNFERISLFNSISGLIRYILIILGAIITQNVYIVIILLAIRRLFDIKLSKKVMREKIQVFNIKSINKTNLFKVFGYYRESIYLSGTQVLQINLNGMISFIISKFYGVEGLGIYRSTYDVLSKIWFFSNGLGLVIFPYFAGQSVGLNKYKNYTYISWVFYTCVYIAFIVLFPFLNKFLLNDTLENNEDIFLFLFTLISVLLVAQGNLSFEFLQAKGNYKYLMKVSFITNLSFLTLALIVNNYIPHTYSVIICWMLSLIIQTTSFERNSLQGNKLILFFSLLLIIIWIFIGTIRLDLLL
ncbi:oligosaccharide flippase family protein [Bacillus sp. NTK074B]|uniref:lipopolysaccharide biosynthesis protein n=1 Tax=Bacillus sp. NTK074B TaxID=2802174 RepID=UPI001A8EC5FC|nr:oligosaccharide flippase family protein [Bacillus sp. NTK074B]